MSKGRAQGSLEYIIIIGGVIILAAATYFMLRGFAQTTSEGTTETIGVAGDKFRLELENLGRSETRFFTKKWGSHPMLSRLTLSNTGESTTADITLYNLSDYGLDLDELEFGYNDSGAIKTLEYTIEQPGNPDSPATFTSQSLPAGTPAVPSSTEILIFHNDSGADELDNLNYTSSDPEVNVTEDGGTSPVQSPDISPPTIVISSTAFGVSGSVKDADIEVTVADSGSSIIEVRYSIDNSPYFKADNLFYGFQDIVLEGHPEDYSYNSNSETIHIIATVPDEDNYTVRVRAVDEYSNERVETQEVSIVLGTPPGDSTPPAIMDSEPANNTLVNDSILALNLTTNENAECRYGGVGGLMFSAMNPMDLSGYTFHQHNFTLVDGENYTYYFKCNDTAGNLNYSDYELNFTKSMPPVDNPPAVLSTEPANNTLVTDSLLTINVSTNEVAHCRFSSSPGTPYSSMNDFNNTDSADHNITDISLEEGMNYKYYFRCNDTAGNVNETDYVLNFTRSAEEVSLMVGWNGSIYFNYSYDGGDTWPDTDFIAGTNMYDPSLMVDNSGLYWLTYHNTSHMYVRNSTDGNSWNPAVVAFVRPDDFLLTKGNIVHATDGVYYMASQNDTSGTYGAAFYNSSDGITWEKISSMVNFVSGGNNGFLQDSSGTFWYASITDYWSSFSIFSSSDCITWTLRDDLGGYETSYTFAVDMLQDSDGMYWLYVWDSSLSIGVVSMNDSDGDNWYGEYDMDWYTVDPNGQNVIDAIQDTNGIYWVVTEHTDGTYIINSTDGINWNTPVKISGGYRPTIIEG